MPIRLSESSAEGNPPRPVDRGTSGREWNGNGLLSAHSAAILAAGTAFAGAVRLLMAIIA